MKGVQGAASVTRTSRVQHGLQEGEVVVDVVSS